MTDNKYKTLVEAVTDTSSAPDFCWMLPYVLSKKDTSECVCLKFIAAEKTKDKKLGFEIKYTPKSAKGTTSGLLSFISREDAQKFAQLNGIQDPSIRQLDVKAFKKHVRVDVDYEVPCYLPQNLLYDSIARGAFKDKKLNRVQQDRISRFINASDPPDATIISDNGSDPEVQKKLSEKVKTEYIDIKNQLDILDTKFKDKLPLLASFFKKYSLDKFNFKSFSQLGEIYNYSKYSFKFQQEKDSSHSYFYIHLASLHGLGISDSIYPSIGNKIKDSIEFFTNASVKVYGNILSADIVLQDNDKFFIQINPDLHVTITELAPKDIYTAFSNFSQQLKQHGADRNRFSLLKNSLEQSISSITKKLPYLEAYLQQDLGQLRFFFDGNAEISCSLYLAETIGMFGQIRGVTVSAGSIVYDQHVSSLSRRLKFNVEAADQKNIDDAFINAVKNSGVISEIVDRCQILTECRDKLLGSVESFSGRVRLADIIK